MGCTCSGAGTGTQEGERDASPMPTMWLEEWVSPPAHSLLPSQRSVVSRGMVEMSASYAICKRWEGGREAGQARLVNRPMPHPSRDVGSAALHGLHARLRPWPHATTLAPALPHATTLAPACKQIDFTKEKMRPRPSCSTSTAHLSAILKLCHLALLVKRHQVGTVPLPLSGQQLGHALPDAASAALSGKPVGGGVGGGAK